MFSQMPTYYPILTGLPWSCSVRTNKCWDSQLILHSTYNEMWPSQLHHKLMVYNLHKLKSFLSNTRNQVHIIFRQVHLNGKVNTQHDRYWSTELHILWTKPIIHNVKSWCLGTLIPYPMAFPYRNGMVLHFYQQQESSTTKTVHRVINKGLKAYV